MRIASFIARLVRGNHEYFCCTCLKASLLRNCKTCVRLTIQKQGKKGKDKVFYGQELPSGESTTTGWGVNYQLLAVSTEVARGGTPSCSRPQPATVDPIDWSHPPFSWAVPPERLLQSINPCSSAKAMIRSRNLATLSMQGNNLAYAATQGASRIVFCASLC